MGWELLVLIGMAILSFVTAYRRNLREARGVERNFRFAGKKGILYPRSDVALGMDYRYLRSHLEKTGAYELYGKTRTYSAVRFESSLTAQEFDDLERKFDFRFPPDLRTFLSLGLPVEPRGLSRRNRLGGWVNWRRDSEAEILERINRPYEGICFDIEHNDIWLESWGEKPPALEDRFEKVKGLIDKAPRLIPILGHRYIPDRPYDVDNPIFSVWQTDIIHYGSNMENYLENEFWYRFGTSVHERSFKEPIKAIEFWTEIVEWNKGFHHGRLLSPKRMKEVLG